MTKKKLVFIPISHKDNYSMSANLSCDNNKGFEIYLQNAIVSLKSVKDTNPDVDIALITNFSPSDFYKNLFMKHNILHYECPFIDFTMPAHYTWSLAFYKIATIKYVIENLDYDYYLQLESDELCINPFEDMWHELEHKILTVFSPFRYDHPNRKVYSKLFNAYCNSSDECMIEKTGAGFIAGNKSSLHHFVEVCQNIYKYIQIHFDELDIQLGDELYTSLYCALHPEKVSRANAYADVYWTKKDFYFVSTNYVNDAVSIIHLPAEKAHGMLSLYYYLLKHEHLPKAQTMYKIVGLPKTTPPFSITRIFNRYKSAIHKRLPKYFNR